MSIVGACLAAVAVAPPAQAAAQSWSRPVGLATPLAGFGDWGTDEPPTLVVNRRGDALVHWLRERDGWNDCCTSDRVMVAYRPAGGAFGPPRPVSPLGDAPEAVTATLGEDGGATIAWTAEELEANVVEATSSRIGYADRLPTGEWTPARTLRAGGRGAMSPLLASVPGGETVIAWEETGRGPLRLLEAHRVRAAWRTGHGRFGTPQVISTANARIREGSGHGYLREPMLSAIGVAPDRTVVVLWQRADGTSRECCLAIELGARPPGVSFAPAQRVSEGAGAEGLGGARVVPDGERGTLLMWSREVEGEKLPRIEMLYRRAGGELGPVERLENNGLDGTLPRVVFRPDGEAVAIWFADGRLWRAVRPAGGTFGPPQELAQISADPRLPVSGVEAAPLPGEDILVAWDRPTRVECEKMDCYPTGHVLESGVVARTGEFTPYGAGPRDLVDPDLAAVPGGALALLHDYPAGPQVAGYGVDPGPRPVQSRRQPRIGRPLIAGCGRPSPGAECTRSARPVFTFSLSEPADVAVRVCRCTDGDLGPSYVIRGRGRKGANRLAIPRRVLRRMRRGRYTAALLAENALGNESRRARMLLLSLGTP